MGVPRLFRFLSQRYPCLTDEVKNNQVFNFDNLYLDMNGIIHQCCFSNYSDADSISEETILKNIFHYVEILVSIVRPKKLLFLAVDGVAPQAKMNNQRARRFRKAKEKEMERKQLLAKGKSVNYDSFDSNCISPGTAFMHHLDQQFQYFVSNKLSNDPTWQKLKVILSGHQTPGEGEHKIMDYIRYTKTLPEYDPNLKHCIFGSDADLMMLVLSTHERNFFIIREKAELNKKKPPTIDEIEFQMINVPFLRDYLNFEFEHLKSKLSFEFNLESIIDDWILMTFLLGNDFIPHLPDLQIKTNAISELYQTYKEVLPTLDGYLNENGYLNLPRFQEFMSKLADHDLKTFEEEYENLAYLEGKMNHSLNLEEWEGLNETDSLNREGEEEGKDENPKQNLRDNELEALIKVTNDLFHSSDDDDEKFDVNAMFLLEFCQKKKDYYSNKLGLGEVTDEVLKNQAEVYVRAIQWNLHYYFHGCPSWTWFYPHHYAPYISDIVNFKDYSLEFDMGQPLLPFEQLMAILPSFSKACVPEVFHHLMTSSESPIIDFYPSDFETDQGLHQAEWEAVVLIPFINQERIKEAMKPFINQLTDEENMRNRHSSMRVFTYTTQNLGEYEAPRYFPRIKANHATRVDIPRDQILVEKSKLVFGVPKGLCPEKCATLKSLPVTASFQRVKIHVFQCPSNVESLVLTLIPQELSTLQELVKNLLGKSVYVSWPRLTEARVVAVANSEIMYVLNKNEILHKETLGEKEVEAWMTTQETIAEQYLRKKGIIIGETKIMVYVNELKGHKHAFDEHGHAKIEKLWCENISYWPLQTVVRDSVEATELLTFKDVAEAYSVGSTVFVLEKHHFGAMGKIIDNSNCVQSGRLSVALEVFEDVKFNSRSTIGGNYMSCQMAAKSLGISSRLLSRITGVVHVISNEDEYEKKNIGLRIKLVSENKMLPGYTKKENNYWLYSEKATKIIAEYIRKFPDVIMRLSEDLDACAFLKENIFQGPNSEEKLEELLEWLKNLNYRKLNFTSTESEIVEEDVVLELERLLSKVKRNVKTEVHQIEPEYLYKSDMFVGNSSPITSSNQCLFDRVVSIKAFHTVPLGLRGVLIGIHKKSTESEDIYEVLFDEPFIGGQKNFSSDNRCYKMTKSFFLNLSAFKRRAAVRMIPEQKQIKNLSSHEKVPESPSAFAKWNQNSSSMPEPARKTDMKDFRQMWLQLQNVKPQEDMLKTLLKIDSLNVDKAQNNVSVNSNEQVQRTIELLHGVQQNNSVDPPRQHQSNSNQPSILKHQNSEQPIFFQRLIQQNSRHPNMLEQSISMQQNPQQSLPSRNYTNIMHENQNFKPAAKNVVPNVLSMTPQLQSFFNAQTQPQSSNFNTLKKYCNERCLAPPKFNIFNVSDKVVAQVTCNNGKVYSSLAMSDAVTAMENASHYALMNLSETQNPGYKNCQPKKGKQFVKNTNNYDSAFENFHKRQQRMNRNSTKISPQAPHHDGNAGTCESTVKHIPKELPYPPKRWVAENSSPSAQNLKNVQPHRGNRHQIDGKFPDKPYKSFDKKSEGVNDKSVNKSDKKPKDSALGFVPLQAITGKRSFKPIVTTQSPSTTSIKAKAEVKNEYKQPIVNLETGETVKTKPKTPKKRHRIAANLNLDPNLC